MAAPHDSFPEITTQSAGEAYDLVLDRVGAWPRDAMNIRTVNEVRTNTGQLQKDDDPLIITGPAAPTDSDLDGMPDEWENRMGLNPTDNTDATGDHDGDGYTNVEEYTNDLALIMLGESPQNVAAIMRPAISIGATWRPAFFILATCFVAFRRRSATET